MSIAFARRSIAPVELNLDENLPLIQADKSQREQVIMNLLTNAGEAGCGMADEQQSKIFDPIFTTQTTGRRLGLAAIQGIVGGHNGAIRIASKPGEGTLFRILFSASVHDRVTSDDAGAAPGVIPRNGGEANRTAQPAWSSSHWYSWT